MGAGIERPFALKLALPVSKQTIAVSSVGLAQYR